MKILICGASGQLGSELTTILREGHASLGAIPSIYYGASIVGTDTSTLDITDKDAVDKLVNDGDFDLITNCAAITNVDGCETNEDGAYKVNAIGAQNLASAAQHTGAKFVHISTDYVFSGNIQVDRIESDTPDPQSAYGRTKLAGEQLVIEACKRAFIVRTAWLYGHTGNNFVKTMMCLARENGAIKVVDDQHGNPTYANDLAYEILKIAATDNYGIYHCTNNGVCSWFDFASAIVDIAGIPCEKTPCTTEEFPRPAKRPAYSSLRNKHLEDTIGDDMRPWRDALEDFLK
jgi:dTDP-4-dehydrorhamnose reductase